MGKLQNVQVTFQIMKEKNELQDGRVRLWQEVGYHLNTELVGAESIDQFLTIVFLPPNRHCIKEADALSLRSKDVK